MFKRRYLKILCLVFVIGIFAFSFVVFPFISFASTPSHLSYTGKLTDTGGNPLGGGGTTYYFKFSLWDASSGGNKLWPTTSPTAHPLTVKQGNFSVLIGDTSNGYPDALDYDFNSNNPVYLQIEVSSDNNTFETLSPRSTLSSNAFSQIASRVSGTQDSSFGTTTGFANTLVSMLSTAVNKAVLTIKGAAGQVANLFNILDSSNNSLFTVTSSGAVGIGTNSPATKFQMYNGSGALTFSITTNTASDAQLNLGDTAQIDRGAILYRNGTDEMQFKVNGTNKMVINSSGNVGIATTTPTEKLTVAGNAKITGYQELGTGNEAMYMGQIPATSNFAGLWLRKTYSTATAANYTFLGDGTNAYFNAASGGNVYFRINNNNQMTLSSSGNVGIGTTNPGDLLSVNGGSLGNKGISAYYSSATYSIRGGFQHSGNAQGYSNLGGLQIYSQGTSNSISGSGAIHFLTPTGNSAGDNIDATLAPRMTILQSGNVGIGTTTPAYLLSVAGDTNITGALRFSGNAGTNGQILQTTGSTAQWWTPNYLSTTTLNTLNPIQVGNGNTASGFGSVSMGYGNTSDGFGSSSFGNGNDSTVGGVALGYGNDGFRGVAVGRFNTASTISSTAVGHNNIASASGASAFGSSITNNIANSTMIGPSDSAKLTILSTGNVGIGTTTPAFPLDVYSTVSSDQTYGYLNSSGLVGTSAGTNSYSIRAQGRILAPEFNAVSDERLKDVQFDLDSDVALQAIKNLNPVSFTWKDRPDGQPVLGFLAQDVEGIIPNAVSKVKGVLFDDQRTLDYNQIVAVLVGAVQEITKKVEVMFAWFGEDQFNIQGEICVDDVCVTKEQFKKILRDAGGQQLEVEEESSSEDSSESDTSTNSDEQEIDTPSDVVTDDTNIDTSPEEVGDDIEENPEATSPVEDSQTDNEASESSEVQSFSESEPANSEGESTDSSVAP